MGKYILIGATVLFFIGMTAFNVSNLTTLKKHEKNLVQKSHQVTNLKTSLDQEKLENEILVDKNIALETKVVELRDSIAMLRIEIRTLRSKFTANKDEIIALNQIITGYEEKYKMLEKQIADATSTIASLTVKQPAIDFGRGGMEFAVASNFVEDIITAKGAEQMSSNLGNFVSVEEIDAEKVRFDNIRKERDQALENIVRLEEEKKYLETELDNLYKLKRKKLVETKEIKEVIVDRKSNEAKFERLAQIVNDTEVKFNKVSVRKNRYGKQLEKVSGRNWRYTVVELALNAPHLDWLLTKRFIIKIKDKDSNKVISFLEVNQNYPYNTIEKDGVEVNFEGGLIEIVHHNNQKKAGKNYELLINYIDSNDEEYTLLNGVTDFIKSGTPIYE